MDKPLPIHADVYCSDGLCGHSVQVVIDPIARQVTHLVVSDKGFLGNEHLVAIDQVAEVAADRIALTCSAEELRKMRPFLSGEHVPGEIPFANYDSGEYSLWPSAQPSSGLLMVEHDHAPEGDRALSRGDSVIAADGPVGRLDEFIVDPGTEKITHLVLRQGHLWGQRVISIPVTNIEFISGNSVTLSLTKAQISELPVMAAAAPMPADSAPPAETDTHPPTRGEKPHYE